MSTRMQGGEARAYAGHHACLAVAGLLRVLLRVPLLPRLPLPWDNRLCDWTTGRFGTAIGALCPDDGDAQLMPSCLLVLSEGLVAAHQQ